ncbi:MAG: hypothetical protein QNJ89_08230 [Acidimicrobiia bacterium]|nr:hypothetical protein [Acidimicrobiia bacterium]
MSIWLVGGGAYFVALLFAFALCRAAAAPDDQETQPCAGAAKPGSTAPATANSLTQTETASPFAS